MKKNFIVLSLFPIDNNMKSGGQARTKAIITELRKISHSVHHVCVFGEHSSVRTRTLDIGVNETWVPLNKKANFAYLNKKLSGYSEDALSGIFLQHNEKLISFLKEILDQKSVIVSNHFWFGAILESFHKTKSVLFSHNFESDFIEQEQSQAFQSFYLTNECQLSDRFDIIAYCSEQDYEKYKNIAGINPSKLIYAPNGTFLSHFNGNRSFKENQTQCLFIGSHWPKNIEGLRTLIQRNKTFLENNTVHCVGSIDISFKNNNLTNLIFHGILSDQSLINLSLDCSFAINPSISGAGSNVKNADYLALGLPIISTPFGLRGYEKYSNFINIQNIDNWSNIEINQLNSVPNSVRKTLLWSNSLKPLLDSLVR